MGEGRRRRGGRRGPEYRVELGGVKHGGGVAKRLALASRDEPPRIAPLPMSPLLRSRPACVLLCLTRAGSPTKTTAAPAPDPTALPEPGVPMSAEGEPADKEALLGPRNASPIATIKRFLPTNRAAWNGVALGQLISLLISCTGVCSQYLANSHVRAPCMIFLFCLRVYVFTGGT